MGAFNPQETDELLDRAKPTGVDGFTTISNTLLGAPAEPTVIPPRSRAPASDFDVADAQPDPTPAAQAASPAAPKDAALDFDPAKLMAEDKARRDNFGMQRLVASVADQFGAIPSVGDIALHRQVAPTHFTQDVDDAQKAAGSAFDRQKNLLDAYQSANKYKDAQALRNPASATSKMMKLNMKSALGVLERGAKNNPDAVAPIQEMQKLLADPNTSGADIQNLIEKNPLMKEQFSAEIASQRMAQQIALAEAKSGTRGNALQDKTLQQVQQFLESGRGDPEFQQAKKDIYAAKKADGLLKMYGDPNSIPQNMVNLYVQELGKIASGGVPSQHELEGISPGTLQGALSTAYGKLVDKPTPANMGAFIKQYQGYTNTLAQEAQDSINSKYRRVLESRRHQLGEDNYNMLNSQYFPDAAGNGPSMNAHGPKPGDVEDGHRFKGGNPADPKNWEAVGGR